MSVESLLAKRKELVAALEQIIANANFVQGRIAQIDELLLPEIPPASKAEPEPEVEERERIVPDGR